MMKALLLAALASSVSGHYRLHGGKAVKTEHSCGASERLQHDHFDVVINADTASVNGTPWKVYERTETGIKLFHGNPDAFVVMTLWVGSAGTTGYVKISGIDANREACSDEVLLEER